MTANVDGVLDLTFLDIRTESDLITQLTEKLTAAPPSSPTATNRTISFTNTTGFDATGTTSSPGRTRKISVKAIRLGNNEITDMSILAAIPLHLDANKIQWIDLSFNHITTTIPTDLYKYFPNLTTI